MRIVVLFTLMLLAGCGSLPQDWLHPENAPTPEETLARAEALREAGRWEAALDALRRAAKRYPEDPRLRQRLHDLDAEWQGKRMLLEDRLLASDIAAMLTRRRLLGQLEAAEQYDLITKSRLALLDSALRKSRGSLLDCARRQAGKDDELARQCVLLADEIQPGEDSRKLRKRLAADDKPRSDAKPRKRKKPRKRHKPTVASETRKSAEEPSLTRLLDQTEELLDSGALIAALEHLRRAGQLDANDVRYQTLRNRVNLAARHQVAELTALGDRLYREEHLLPALAIWRIAQRLAPDDAVLKVKVERAERIAAKLERIRAKQPASTAETPTPAVTPQATPKAEDAPAPPSPVDLPLEDVAAP